HGGSECPKASGKPREQAAESALRCGATDHAAAYRQQSREEHTAAKAADKTATLVMRREIHMTETTIQSTTSPRQTWMKKQELLLCIWMIGIAVLSFGVFLSLIYRDIPRLPD